VNSEQKEGRIVKRRKGEPIHQYTNTPIYQYTNIPTYGRRGGFYIRPWIPYPPM